MNRKNVAKRIKYQQLPCHISVYVPDFGTLGKLQQEYGNDVDLMVQKPQYRDLIGSTLQPIENASEYPNLSDEQLAESLPSREMDINELAEYARVAGDKYREEAGKSA